CGLSWRYKFEVGMEDPSKIYRILIKFMDEQYVDSFVNEGLIFMNNIEFFRRYEADEGGVPVRGDKHEGLTVSLNAKDLVVTFDNQVVDGLVGKVDVRLNHEDETNLYSMTRISDLDILESGDEGYYLSPQFMTFGNKAVIISGDNINTFNERLSAAIHNDPHTFTFREDGIVTKQVEYVERESYHGEMGVFRKFSDYSWQREWRIAFKQSLALGPHMLKLGSLKDIVTVADTAQLIKNPIKLVERENL
uniref:hypothetical protein n=1 Tax=Vibrio penaeicida TaxID=104609 RepID=UPI001F3D8C09